VTGTVGVYWTLLRATVAGQAAYRASFGLELVGSGLVITVDFIEVLAIFTQVPEIVGFSFAEVFLLFGLASVGFSLADFAVGAVRRSSKIGMQVLDGSRGALSGTTRSRGTVGVRYRAAGDCRAGDGSVASPRGAHG